MDESLKPLAFPIDPISDPKVSILLVDDKPANLLSLTALLDELGLNLDLVQAHSGEEAVLEVQSGNFAVVLLDVLMPGMSGFEAARIIRNTESVDHTPIIFLTASDISRSELEEGYALGAVDFLVKPIIPVALQSKVRTFVQLFQEKQRTRREGEDQLRLSEQRFSRFMQHLPGLAWIKDIAGRYVYANDAAEKAFQKNRNELYGKTDEEVFPPATAAQFRKNDQQAISSGLGVQVIEELEHGDGVRRTSLVTKFPIGDRDGQISLVGGMSIDITEQRRVEQALKNSEKRFRGLMEQAPFSVQILVPDGRTLAVNKAWEKLWGLELEHVADYNILEDPQLEAKGVAPYLRRAFAGETVAIPAIQYDPNETIPSRTRHHDARRWVSAVAYPLRDEVGAIREIVLVHDDITARRQAEEATQASERLYRAIGESIDYGIWICDPQGRNVYASESFLKLIGMTQEQCSAFGWADMLHPDDVEPNLAKWAECVRTGKQLDVEHRFRGVDGQWHSTLARGVPVRNEQGEITCWAGINLNISRIKNVEEKLREADRRKDEFLAILAHELRNPLAPICNSLQILKMPKVDASTVQQTREMMERQVNHLIRLVDDLLDVSRVMQGKIELRKERVDLALIVARAIETVQPLIDAQKHKLEIALPSEPLELDADPIRLSQVIGNLLSNSVKFTAANGHLRLSAWRDGNDAMLKIEDNGIGIAAESLPHIFELFVQADQGTTKAHGGLGVGLTLVKKLVEMHNGTVQVHSSGLGKGSEFEIRLPLAIRPYAKQIEHQNGETTQYKGPDSHRILVVDDNQDAALSLAMLLRLQQHEVEIAYDGISALEAATKFRPNLIFLDIGMPVMDGIEVAKRIRKTPELEKVVLVALTGWGQQEDRRRTTEAGFDQHLVKPPDPQLIENLVAQLTLPSTARD